MNSRNKNNKYNARLVVRGHTNRGFNYEKYLSTYYHIYLYSLDSGYNVLFIFRIASTDVKNNFLKWTIGLGNLHGKNIKLHCQRPIVQSLQDPKVNMSPTTIIQITVPQIS